MTFRPILSIPILFVALGMGLIFSLPVAMTSWTLKKEQASACSVNIAASFAKSPYVLTGTVSQVLMSGNDADVWIEPLTWYKGRAASPFIRFVAPATSTTAVGKTPVTLNFVTGPTVYLLYLRQSAGDVFRTSPCFGTRVLGAGLTKTEAAVFGVQSPR